MSRVISRIGQWWRERQRRREWSAERQLEHIRVLVQMDHRWLAHSPVADALTERYLWALSKDWYRLNTEDIRDLRQRLGLDPHAVRTQSNGAPQ